MKGLLYGVLIATPLLLGNSAAGFGGLVTILGGAILVLCVIIAISWGLIKWLS
tara:strand:+ start:31 stop:189 length:159 start_codon:yes stop_codon:yes gene_type:complete